MPKLSIEVKGDVEKAVDFLAKKLQSLMIEHDIPGIVVKVGKKERKGVIVFVPININDEGELKDIVNRIVIAVSI